jgi:hypothetical protein
MKARFTLQGLGCMFTVAAGACGPPASETYADLGLNTFDADGTLVRSECMPMPVLLGSKVVKDYFLAPGLAAHVVAVPEYADVTVSGTSDPAASHQHVSHEQLAQGYVKAIPVETTEDIAFTVVLAAPCNHAP